MEAKWDRLTFEHIQCDSPNPRPHTLIPNTYGLGGRDQVLKYTDLGLSVLGFSM